jgi:hypothetical protein
MTEKQVLEQKKFGDINIVAEIIGETRGNTSQILRRPTAKKHKKAMEVLRRLVESRQQIATEISTE